METYSSVFLKEILNLVLYFFLNLIIVHILQNVK